LEESIDTYAGLKNRLAMLTRNYEDRGKLEVEIGIHGIILVYIHPGGTTETTIHTRFIFRKN
jgi:hypothetical protein